MTTAFQENAFQNNAFQISGIPATTGLYVAEFNTVGEFPGELLGRLVMAEVEQVANQVVGIGAMSASSNLFDVRTRFIRLNTDRACLIEIGVDPDAAVSKTRMSANQTEYFALPPGAAGTMKVAVITL